MRPRLLDLFCGAGGAGMGYYRAGFEVVGVDIKPQKNYPFEFHQTDALEFVRAHGKEFDVIHASPPCQPFSTIAKQQLVRGNIQPDTYLDLVDETRKALINTGVPFVMENVIGAPLRTLIVLCGSSFGLDVRRHRAFESNLFLWGVPCDHSWQTPRFKSMDTRRSTLSSVVAVHGKCQYAGELIIRRKAMGIDWMSSDELSEAIPPHYTEYIGEQLMQHLKPEAA